MGSSPSPPDPMQTAMAQGQMNIEAAKEQQSLNMTNQVTPYGTLTYTKTPNTGGGNPFGWGGGWGMGGGGGDLPGAYTATTALSPQMQTLFNTNAANAQQSAQIGGQLQSNAAVANSQPLNLGWSATEANLDALNRNRLDPLWAQNANETYQSLHNQGLSPGDAGYDQQLLNFNQAKNDAYNQMFLQGHGQAVSDILQQYNNPINAAAAWRSGGQIGPYQPNMGFVQTPQASVQAPNYAGLVEQNYQQQSQNSNAMMGGLFGLGGQLLSGGASLLSDPQDKTDIQKLGQDPQTGANAYAFRYKGDPKSYPKVVGPMAPDVERAVPGSTRIIGGHRAINGLAGLAGRP